MITKCPFMRTSPFSADLLKRKSVANTASKICPHLKKNPTLSTAAVSQISYSPQNNKIGYDSMFSGAVDQIKEEGRYRVFADLEREAGNFPVAKCYDSVTGKVKKVTGWCSNDYLAMGQNPKVLNALTEAARTCGAGAGGTRNISGTNHFHVLLEKELAELHNKEAALVFSSCYVANETTLTTMSRVLKDSVIFSDSMNHASMIQGIRYGSWEKQIYNHDDLDHLESLLKKQPLERQKVIAYESVNSMEGSIAPMNEINYLAEKYNALTFCDEVHAVGMYGKTGAGVAERDDALDGTDIISGTLGKAYGVVGGYIVGSNAFIDAMRSKGPGFIFTTAIPPAIAAAALESVKHLRNSSVERSKMHKNALKLQRRLRSLGLPLLPTVSHITPILVGDAVKCKLISDTLMQEHNIYVQPINFPTVPKGTERLRLTPLPVHTEEMMDKLVDALDEVWTKVGLERSYPTANEMLAEQKRLNALKGDEFGYGAKTIYDFYEGHHNPTLSSVVRAA